jgi:hypothetical protein
VVQTHGKNIVAMRALATAVGLTSADRNLVLAPLFAQFGLRCGQFIDMIVGAANVVDSVFDGQRIIDLVEQERISFLPGPPTILAAMLSPLAQGRDISSLRLTLTGSTVIPEELVVTLQENQVFDHVLTAYGLTEACGPVSVSSLDDTPAQVCTYAGRALDHVQIRIVDPDTGATLGPNERGEFLVHSAVDAADPFLDLRLIAEDVDDHLADTGTGQLLPAPAIAVVHLLHDHHADQAAAVLTQRGDPLLVAVEPGEQPVLIAHPGEGQRGEVHRARLDTPLLVARAVLLGVGLADQSRTSPSKRRVSSVMSKLTLISSS